jgi:hypothetical protein
MKTMEKTADAYKLEVISATNPLVSMIIEMFRKFTNYKFTCPMMQASIKVLIIFELLCNLIINFNYFGISL